MCKQLPTKRRSLNTKSELDANIDVAGHLNDLGELHRLLGGGLQVIDGEDLEAGVVELGSVLAVSLHSFDVHPNAQGHDLPACAPPPCWYPADGQ